MCVLVGEKKQKEEYDEQEQKETYRQTEEKLKLEEFVLQGLLFTHDTVQNLTSDE